MYHYYVILGGMILGMIILLALSKQEPEKKKIKIEEDEMVELQQKENIQPNFQIKENENNLCSKPNDDDEAVRKRKIESDQRKDKIFRNLSEGDRKIVEEYFEKKAKQLTSGKIDPSDRRANKLISIIKFSLYATVGIIVYLLLSIAFDTTSPMMIVENLKHLTHVLFQQMFAKK